MEHRSESKLIQHISNRYFSKEDLESLEKSVPIIIANMYALPSKKEFARAIALYLQANDFISAERCTVNAIKERKLRNRDAVLEKIAGIWQSEVGEVTKEIISNDSSAFLLYILFHSPLEAARTQAKESTALLGHNLIKRAVLSHQNLTLLDLHCFGPNEFEFEVSNALASQFENNMVDAVFWYHNRKDLYHAKSLTEGCMKSWSNEELLETLVGKLKIFPSNLVSECQRRTILPELTKTCLSGPAFNLDFALEATNQAISSQDEAERNSSHLISVWYEQKDNIIIRGSEILFGGINIGHSNVKLFLSIIFDPKNVSKQNAKLSFKRFGENVVESCVSHTFVGKPHLLYSTLLKFDSKAFAHLCPKNPKSEPELKPKGVTQDNNALLFSKGDQVIIHSLSNAIHLNGKYGTINEFNKKKGRYAVLVYKSKNGKPILIQQKNLRRRDDGFNSKLHPGNVADLENDSISNADSEESLPPLIKHNNRHRRNSSSSSSDDNVYIPSHQGTKNSLSSSDSDSDSDSVPSLQGRRSSASSLDSMPLLVERKNSTSSSDSSYEDSD